MIGSHSSSRLPALAAAAACLLAACGQEQDASERRPIGQRPSTTGQRQLPEDHPDIGQMGQPEGGGQAGGPREGISETMAARIDSGNAAYRAGDYRRARRHFREAVREDPDYGAAWFGLYMAEKALGNDDAADSALQRSGDLSDAPPMHPAPGDTAGGGSPPSGGAGGPGG